jgi:diguanylate cyclase (GGDEF)-like protein
VNRRTLQLFEADDLQHLVDNLGRVFRDAMFEQHVSELEQLWNGQTHFTSQTVNYTLGGKRLDIELQANVLPGHEASWERVLIAIDDVTARASAQRDLARSESYARGLFEHSPVSLWVEDFSSVKRLLDDVRAMGITDFRAFINVHPDFILQCMQEIRVLDVNRQTLSMFAAGDRAQLLRALDDVFRDDMRFHFAEQLVDLWHNKLFQQREVVNYALNGDKLHVYMQFSVLPGHEANWGLVLVSLTDITARKKAEAYLEYLGKHDVLTKLRNRAFFSEEMNRLERKGPYPITLIAADLNGLKATNDQLGHAAGDALLQRVGEVLGKLVDKPMCAARIGGDEFALLLPGTDLRGGEQLIERIQTLVEVNNQFYSGTRVSLAMGVATCEAGERLEVAMHRADARMYAAKREFYEAGGHDRRTGPGAP